MAIINIDIKNKSGIEDGSKKHPYNKIQKGIGVAKSGDIVKVAAGTYKENVTIDKSLTLQGENKDTTIINGGGSGNVVYITASYVTLEGLKITNGKNGIYLIPNWRIHHITIKNTIISSNTDIAFMAPHSGGFHLIEDCIISKNGCASYAHQFRNSIVRSCKIFNNKNGLGVAWGHGTLITGNNVHHNGRGIGLDSMTGAIVERNKIHKNKTGIHIAYVGNRNVIRENIFTQNGLGVDMGEQYVRNNKIYHNNIIKNKVQANDRQKDNKWDNGYPSGGNYWSDYTGVDDGSSGKTSGDGIGDTKVPHLGFDNYPLMKKIKINMTPRKVKILPMEKPLKSSIKTKISPAEKPPRYLGNSNTKEIHDLKNINGACQISRMKSQNKVFFKSIKDIKKAMHKKGYNGCKWCLSKYNTG